MKLTETLCSLAKEKNVKFIFSGKNMSYEEVFSETGLLPAIARRADRISLLCLGYGIGATFIEAEKTVLGSRVQFDEVTPNALRLLCIYDVLLEIIKISPSPDQVVLDELMYD